MTLFRNAIAEIRDLFKLAYGAPFEGKPISHHVNHMRIDRIALSFLNCEAKEVAASLNTGPTATLVCAIRDAGGATVLICQP